MKKLFLMLFAFALLVAFSPSPLRAAPDHDQGATFISLADLAPAVTVQEEGGGVAVAADTNAEEVAAADSNFFAENWVALVLGLMGFIELIVRLTPSEKDNSIFNWLAMLINALLPNIKKGGGTFKVSSK